MYRIVKLKAYAWHAGRGVNSPCSESFGLNSSSRRVPAFGIVPAKIDTRTHRQQMSPVAALLWRGVETPDCTRLSCHRIQEDE